MHEGQDPSWSMTINDAIALYREMDDLLAEATPDEHEWLITEFDQDPTYRTARYGKEVVSEIAGFLATRSAKVSEIPESRESIHDLLDDLEIDKEAIAAQAELQRMDIAGIHEMLDGFVSMVGTRHATKKVQAEANRFIRSEFRNRWSAEMLADDPMRLKNILESIASKEDATQLAKHSAKDYFLEQVKEYVIETARDVDPSVIGRRIEASLLPGPADEDLQGALLSAYFKQAEGYQETEDALDNYERFVLGIIKVIADKPDLAKRALNIVNFRTDLLPEDSLYAFKVIKVPTYRPDKPELFGRIYGTLVTISRMAASLGTFDELRPSTLNPLANMESLAENYRGGPVDQRTLRKMKRNHAWTASIHLGIAQNSIGKEEFEKRYQVIRDFRGVATDPRKMAAIISEKIIQDEGYSSLAVYISEYLKAQYPGMEEFIDQVVSADVPLNKELASQTSDVNLFSNNSIFKAQMMRDVYSAMGEYLIEHDDELKEAGELFGNPDKLVDFAKEQTTVITRSSGDGYTLEFYFSRDHEPSDEDILETIGRYGREIDEAKQSIKNLPNSGRQAYTVTTPSHEVIINVRPESKEDKKAYHGLDTILGETYPASDEYDPQESLVDSLLTIEQAREVILTQRRRFLNERGIYFAETEDDETIKITINKHPNNPHYFVCSVELNDGDNTQTAKVLMGPDLRFNLGNKKVRSQEHLAELNSMAAVILAYFMTDEVVDTEEGKLGEDKNSVTARIAHLRLLPDGQKYSYQAWQNCLEAEGLDLELLSDQQQIVYDTARRSTYVSAVEKDELSLGPLRIYIPEEPEAGETAA